MANLKTIFVGLELGSPVIAGSSGLITSCLTCAWIYIVYGKSIITNSKIKSRSYIF